MKFTKSRRVTLWKSNICDELEIDFTYPLSDGYGIPAIVIGCPIEEQFTKFTGLDEYGDEVEGISFDECSECRYFDSLGFGQEIICYYEPQQEHETEVYKV